MLFTTPEQRRARLEFPCAGPFRPFGRQKDMRERLEFNPSERLRLETARTPPTFAGEPTLLVNLYTSHSRRSTQHRDTKKERMPTFVDILFALQVGLEPTTP